MKTTKLFIFLAGIFLSNDLYSSAEQNFRNKLAKAALERTNHDVIYDPTYFKITYPGGDVPSDRGVCTDVIIRSYRTLGIDLQELVHKDMKANFKRYPNRWGLKETDKNIDHRRVPNLEKFFERFGKKLKVTDKAEDYKPGDIVTWNVGGRSFIPHIGIVVNKKSDDQKRFLIVHNIGAGPKCEDALFSFPIIGHYVYHVS